IAGPFAISENLCIATGTWDGVMAPGTHCDLSVVFAPVAGGDASGTLSISAAGSVYPATLSGTGAALADVTPPTDSLAGHWKLDEGNSTNAGDSSGNGNTGKLKGRPTWTTGKEGFAVAFDGTNDYVSIPNDASLNAYPLTIAAWIKTSATGLQGIVNKYSRNSFKGYQLLSNGGNLCAWYFKDKSNYIGDGTDCPLATPGYNDDQWHHVAFVVDSTGGRLYVDGSEKASLAWTGTPGATSTGQALSFGRYPKMSGSYFSGDLDDVRIYSRALSADEVEALFYAAISSAP
ncbi:MAG: LamG domain-containing protein, partial [Deltaproteobacteria bacterium]|nr:LamG domain-containing protein [Deltaproteobacteria bacterium]